jgi:hypothetical protein
VESRLVASSASLLSNSRVRGNHVAVGDNVERLSTSRTWIGNGTDRDCAGGSRTIQCTESIVVPVGILSGLARWCLGRGTNPDLSLGEGESTHGREIHNQIVANDSDGHVLSSRILSDDPRLRRGSDTSCDSSFSQVLFAATSRLPNGFRKGEDSIESQKTPK